MGMIQKIKKDLIRLGHDESGAAMVEYTILLGIITVAVIALIIGVGTWVSSKWNTLNSALATAP
jgi:pilus assembly protein Flp/PilA